MKRILCIIAAIVLFASLLAPAVFCASDFSVTASNNAKTGKIVLKWNEYSKAKSYYIYRSSDKNGSYTKCGSTSALSFTDNSCEVAKAYYYNVKAIDSTGKVLKTSASVKRICDCAAPTLSISNNAKTGKISLKWSAVDGAKGYSVCRSKSQNGEYSKLCTTTSTSYTDKNAAAGHKYYYKIKAVSADTEYANSAYSGIAYRVCDCAKVGNVGTAWNSSGKTVFSWKAAEGADGYKILRSSSKNGSFSQLAIIQGTKYTDTSAKAGQTYYYKIIASSSLTASADSSPVTLSAAATYPKPQNLQDVSTDTATAIKWDATDGVDGYAIFRGSVKNYEKMEYVKTVKRTRMTDDGVYSGVYYAVMGYKELSNGNTLLSVPAYIYIK